MSLGEWRHDGLRLHRAAAAFLAIVLRCSGVSFFARAFPPLFPPSRPSATAAGFLPWFGGGGAGAWPVAISTISLPSWFGSRGLFGFLPIAALYGFHSSGQGCSR